MTAPKEKALLLPQANRTSTVDVEQILGRILRQPYAMQHKSPLLNTSYVLTNSSHEQNVRNAVIAMVSGHG